MAGVRSMISWEPPLGTGVAVLRLALLEDDVAVGWADEGRIRRRTPTPSPLPPLGVPPPLDITTVTIGLRGTRMTKVKRESVLTFA